MHAGRCAQSHEFSGIDTIPEGVLEVYLLLKRVLLIGGAVVAVLGISLAVFALSTWGEVQRVDIARPDPEPVAAPEPEADAADEPAEEPEEPEEPTLGLNRGLDVVLMVGSDSRDELDDLDGFGEFSGQRADVVMVMIRTDAETAILSLPRDLYIDNECTGGRSRINVMLGGCGEEINGPTLLTITVEELIGEPVDHFAMVDLAGFLGAVDAVGGYEICVDNAVRDSRSKLELPAGCTMADGEQTLAWVRSRSTQELTDNGWRTMSGMNDLARNERQREFLIDMVGQLSDFSSPQSMAAAASAIAPFMTVDSELTLTEAVDLAWALRSIDSNSIVQLDVPVYGHVTDRGASVLLPRTPIDEIVANFLAMEANSGSSALAG